MSTVISNLFLEIASSREPADVFLVISYDQGFGDHDVFKTFAGAMCYFSSLPGGELWYFTHDAQGGHAFSLLLNTPTSETNMTLYALDYKDACNLLAHSPYGKTQTAVLLCRSVYDRRIIAHRILYARAKGIIAANNKFYTFAETIDDSTYVVLFRYHAEYRTRFGGYGRLLKMHRRIPTNIISLTVLNFYGKGPASNLYWRT